MFAGSGGERTLIVRPPLDHTVSVQSGASEIVVKGWQDMWDVFSYLSAEGGAANWDWVWLDSISLFQEVGLDELFQDAVAKNPARRQFGLSVQEYGINMHRLSTWIRDMVELNKFNFGITAHPKELAYTEDPDADEKLMPYVQGKNMATKVCGYMNVVGYYEITSKGSRFLRFNATDKYYAKDQFDAFPEGKLKDPTVPKFLAAIEESAAGKAKPKPRRKTTQRKRRING